MAGRIPGCRHPRVPRPGESTPCPRLRKERWALRRPAGALGPAAARWKEACLLIPRRWLRLLLLPPGGTVGLNMVSPCDVGHRAWTASWGRCARRHPQLCQLRGLQLHGQRTWPPHRRTLMMTHTGQGFFSDSFGKRV